MKRYKVILGTLEDHPAIGKAKMDEDPDGEWVKWEDVKGIEDLGFKLHDGYIRIKDIATGMAVSLHQVFDRNAATFRFKVKDNEPIIIDVDMDVFEKFMRTHSVKEKEPESLSQGTKLTGTGVQIPYGIINKQLECNCEKELQSYQKQREELAGRFVPRELIPETYFWICPAHGYKRR